MPDFEYDVFENLPNGATLWRDCVHGVAAASQRVEELGRKTKNEIVAIRIITREIVARANGKEA
jgi:hypothetical protein